MGGAGERSVVDVLARDFENVLGLRAVGAVGIVVGEGVVLVDDFAEAVGLAFVDAHACLLVAGLEDEEFEVLLVFRVGIVLDGVAGHDYAAFEVVAHVVSEVVVELGVLKLLECELVLKLEDGVLGDADAVGAGEEVEEALKLFDGLDGAALVELGVGGVEVVAVTGVEARVLGVLAFGIALVVGLEVCPGCEVVLVLVVAHSEEEEGFLGLVGAFEDGDAVFEDCGGLDVAFFLVCTLGVVELVVVVVALLHALVFAAGAKEESQESREKEFLHCRFYE